MNFYITRTFFFLESLIEYKHENDSQSFLNTLGEANISEVQPFHNLDTHFSTPRLLLTRVLKEKISMDTLKKDIERSYGLPKHYNYVWKK